MIKQALDHYFASTNKSWQLERGLTVGASAVGGCARMTWFSKNEGDPDAKITRDPDYVESYGALVRGTVIEDHFWAPALKLVYGDKLLYAGSDQRTLVLDLLSATADALLTGQKSDALKHLGVEDIEGSEIVLECKSLDSRFNVENLPKAENVFQIQTQMGLFHAVTKHRPKIGVLSYVDAGWWDVCHEHVVRYDPKVFQVALARARDIMLASSAQELKPEGVIAGGKDCRYCPFTRACGAVRAERVPRSSPSLAPEQAAPMAAQARAIRELKAKAEQAAAEAREAEARLRDMMAEAGTRQVEGDGVKVRWSAVKPRASLDAAALREAATAAGIDITQFNKFGAPSDQLVISAPKAP